VVPMLAKCCATPWIPTAMEALLFASVGAAYM